MMLIPSLRFLTIVTTGVAAGTMVHGLLATVPTNHAVPPAMALRFHKELEVRIDRYNPTAVIMGTLAAFAILLLERSFSSWPSVLTGVGLLGSLGIGITSLGFNRRINRRFRPYPLDAIPDEYFALRRRWERVHVIRTISSLVALSAYTLAALV